MRRELQQGWRRLTQRVIPLILLSTGRTKRIAGIAVGASVFAIILGCAFDVFWRSELSVSAVTDPSIPWCDLLLEAIVFWIWRTERNGRRKLAAYVCCLSTQRLWRRQLTSGTNHHPHRFRPTFARRRAIDRIRDGRQRSKIMHSVYRFRGLKRVQSDAARLQGFPLVIVPAGLVHEPPR